MTNTFPYFFLVTKEPKIAYPSHNSHEMLCVKQLCQISPFISCYYQLPIRTSLSLYTCRAWPLFTLSMSASVFTLQTTTVMFYSCGCRHLTPLNKYYHIYIHIVAIVQAFIIYFIPKGCCIANEPE